MDTVWDFPGNATCLGGQKRDLAGGNLRIDIGF
jgi:hypothetical protein